VRPGRAADRSPPSNAAVVEEYSCTSTHPLGHTGPVTGSLHLLIISHSFLLRMRNVSDKSCTENQNTHFVFSNFFSQKPYRLGDFVGKCDRAGHATDGNMAHAHCMLDNRHYKRTLRICNTHCFSRTANVARTRLAVTLDTLTLAVQFSRLTCQTAVPLAATLTYLALRYLRNAQTQSTVYEGLPKISGNLL